MESWGKLRKSLEEGKWEKLGKSFGKLIKSLNLTGHIVTHSFWGFIGSGKLGILFTHSNTKKSHTEYFLAALVA